MNLTTKSLLTFFALIFVISCSNTMEDSDAPQTAVSYTHLTLPTKA